MKNKLVMQLEDTLLTILKDTKRYQKIPKDTKRYQTMPKDTKR